MVVVDVAFVWKTEKEAEPYVSLRKKGPCAPSVPVAATASTGVARGGRCEGTSLKSGGDNIEVV